MNGTHENHRRDSIRHAFYCISVLAFCAGCQPTYKEVDYAYDDAKSDLENLRGEWVCVAAKTSGQSNPRLIGRAYEFRGNEFLMKARPKNSEWIQTEFSIDEEDGLKRVTVILRPPGSTILVQKLSMLYRFADGSLEICEAEVDRIPYEFESTAENGNSLRTFRRVQ